MAEDKLTLPPEVALVPEAFDTYIRNRSGETSPDRVFRILKRSIDARSKRIAVHVTGEWVDAGKERMVPATYHDVHRARRVIIVGAGPAGLFAALKLAEAGLKPILFERGKDVQSRRRDLAAINKEHVVNPESNYCFGEGGAGTYSDGKLYTRSTKRGDVQRVLEILVAHGAPEEILYEAHPHIGTNKLHVVVSNMRKQILAAGGEIYFNQRVEDFLISDREVKGIRTAEGAEHPADAVILATGHSARDIFEWFHAHKFSVEAKPFAVGVRVEHPQSLIDRWQYHLDGNRPSMLPAASYALVHQVGKKTTRGVFSFCMCPGGFIVPAATSPGQVVVNGMSPSRRDSRFANSGIVVAFDGSDIPAYAKFGPLQGMKFQQAIEERACVLGGGTQMAPAQRLVDFVEGRNSSSLPDCSYQPGLASASVAEVFPDFIGSSLREAFKAFGKKMRGYLTNEAVVLATESRTSSPVRIPRDPVTLEHPEIGGLYPCGEGAGYAGGIMSAAMDGERCAVACAARLLHVTKSISDKV